MATTIDNDGDDINNAFDPEREERERKAVNELKKHNIKSVFGSGAGRIAGIVVGLAFLLLIIVGAWNMFGKRKPPPTDNAANGAVLSAPLPGDPTVMTDQEAELRRRAIGERAKEAQEKGGGYIAPPVLRSENQQDPGPPKAPAQPASAAPPVLTDPNADADRARRIAEMQKMREQIKKDEVMPQMLVAMGRDPKGASQPTFTTGMYNIPDRTPKQAAMQSSTGAAGTTNTAVMASAAAKELIIQAGDGYYCDLQFGINTDAPRNEVFASCHQGKLKNAKLTGKYDPPKEGSSDPSVTVTFSQLSLPNRPAIAVQAVAIDDISESTALADDVNNHTVRKYGGLFLASLARGFGQAASIVTGSTISSTNGATSTTTTTVDPISGAQQTKIAVGAVGTTLGESLQKSSDAIKPTVKTNRNKGIRVVFLSDVFDEKK